MRRLLLLLGVLLAVAVPASAVSTAVTAEVFVTTDGPTATFRIKNTGTEPINCFRIELPAGVTATEVVFPPGWAGGVAQQNPRIIIGIPIPPPGIAPGATLEIDVTTANGYPAYARSKFYFSSSCDIGSDVMVLTSGPGPCRCEDIDITTAVGNYTASRVSTFPVKWTLDCNGAPGFCKGEIKVAPPPFTDVKITQPAKGKSIKCLGRCGRENKGTYNVIARGNDLDLKERKGKAFAYSLKGYCVEGNKRIQVAKAIMLVVYDKRGFTDRKKSDLNANGKPDGREK